MISFTKKIAYTKSWKYTLLNGLILGAILAFIIIFLKPFDTSEAIIENSEIKYMGYGLCVVISILAVHFLENYKYEKQGQKWFLWNEILSIAIIMTSIVICCYFYNIFIVNNQNEVSFRDWLLYYLYFGFPFLPILTPVLVYLRSKFGVIKALITQDPKPDIIHISGENKVEKLTIDSNNFIYAQAQQNYVIIFFKENDMVSQKMLRSTLTRLASQIPNAWQVHRSFLVNLDFLKSVQGNSRKRSMSFTLPIDDIPISNKYYQALTERLAVSSQ